MANLSSLAEAMAEIEDATDAKRIGGDKSSTLGGLRPLRMTLTRAEDEQYSMEHPKRGDCIIFTHQDYAPGSMCPARDTADYDAQICKKAFDKLGFNVQIEKDRKKAEFRKVLQEVSQRDHSDSDALVLVFMSHGSFNSEEVVRKDRSKLLGEVLHTFDGEVRPSDLWEPFVGDKCPSLAGKPKLVFIQACRGEALDYGVGLSVQTDSLFSKKKQEESYVVPAHADLLVMWASFSGMFAFKSQREGIRGSVFIHFLTKTLLEEGETQALGDLLLKVTRRVAIDFESSCPNSRLHHNKQVPQISSTLMRRILFTAKQ